MQDNVLKKQFNERAVKRVRDLVKGTTGEATGTQVGYTKQLISHKEGEIWEENGKQWTIKNGIKQNITKLDRFKDLVRIPLLCPTCSNPLKTEYDKKMYNIHKKCLNCVVSYETQLKISGKYEEYSSNIINNNREFILNDYEQFLNDMLKTTKISDMISEDGTIENWIGSNKELIEKAKKQLEDIKSNNK